MQMSRLRPVVKNKGVERINRRDMRSFRQQRKKNRSLCALTRLANYMFLLRFQEAICAR